MPTNAADEGRRAPPPPATGLVVPEQFLSRDLLTRRPIRTVDVVLPGGGRVKIRALKQGERERLDDEALEKTYKDDGGVSVKLKNLGFQAKALAMCMVNDDMSAYWPSVEEGMAALAEMDDQLFDLMFEPCDKLNILTTTARKELVKDSAPTPSSSSSSKLPTSGDASLTN